MRGRVRGARCRFLAISRYCYRFQSRVCFGAGSGLKKWKASVIGKVKSVWIEFSLFSLVREKFEPQGTCTARLPLWDLIFLNYTKMTKYEALEKNAVSRKCCHSAISSTVAFSKSIPLLGDFRPVRRSRNWVIGVSGGGRATGIEPSPRGQK